MNHGRRIKLDHKCTRTLFKDKIPMKQFRLFLSHSGWFLTTVWTKSEFFIYLGEHLCSSWEHFCSSYILVDELNYIYRYICIHLRYPSKITDKTVGTYAAITYSRIGKRCSDFRMRDEESGDISFTPAACFISCSWR